MRQYARILFSFFLGCMLPLMLYGIWMFNAQRSPVNLEARIVAKIHEEMSACREDPDRRLSCYEEAAGTLLKTYGLFDLMHAFEIAEEDTGIYQQCHAFTHYLGREAYGKEGSVQATYPSCTEACWGGCYHGVIEAHLALMGLILGVDDAKIIDEVIQTCGAAHEYAVPLEHAECLHGLGHALMYITGEDLFRSLEFCDALGEQASICYGGVFMENSSASTNKDHPPKYINPDDPLYPCSILPKQYLASCYRYQSSHFHIISERDPAKVSELCMRVPAAYRVGCFEVMGSNQVGNSDDYVQGRINCAFASAPYEVSCTQGMAGAIGIRFPKEPERMFAFCADVSKDMQTACYARAGQTLVTTQSDPIVREQLCTEQVPDVLHVLSCLGVSTEEIEALTGE